MSTNYIALAQAIVIDTDNNKIRVTVGATTEEVTVASGTYYISGQDADSTMVFNAIETAIESHSSSPTITKGARTAFNINGTSQKSFEWSLTSSTTISILWTNAATTFPYTMIGASGTSTGTTHTNSTDPRGFWVSDQPPASETKNNTFRDVTQNPTFDGGTFTFKRGYLQGSYGFDFDFINPERVLQSEENSLVASSKHRTFENFLFYANGDGVRVNKLSDTGTPGTLSGIDAASLNSNTFAETAVTTFLDYIIDEDTLSSFAPDRFSAGLELYEFSLGLKPKRV